MSDLNDDKLSQVVMIKTETLHDNRDLGFKRDGYDDLMPLPPGNSQDDSKSRVLPLDDCRTVAAIHHIELAQVHLADDPEACKALEAVIHQIKEIK
jgi:hypothetical protein